MLCAGGAGYGWSVQSAVLYGVLTMDNRMMLVLSIECTECSAVWS